MRHIVKISTLILLAARLNTHAQSFSQTRLDSLFKAVEAYQQGSGSVCITHNGKVVYSKGFGSYADAQHQIDAKTQFRIGSITKTFTALMVLQLVNEHKLELKTRIDKYFPQVPNAAAITVDELLTHTSGIHNFTADADFNVYSTKPATKTQMLARIARFRPDFRPGEKTAVSNTNYLLLGYLIEQLTGKSYAANLQQRITGKLALQRTRYCGNYGANQALSYIRNGVGSRPVALSDLSVQDGSGGVVSTPADMAAFIRALFKLKLGGQSILTGMMPLSGSLGRGLIQVPVANQIGFGYFSAMDGFKCSLLYLPQTDLAVAVCFNSAQTDDNAVVEQVLSISLQQLQHIVTLPAAQLVDYKGVYTSKQLPTKITIGVSVSHLSLQADKREPLILETLSATQFRFVKGDMLLNFDTLPNKTVKHFTLKQGGKVFEFYR
jgi:D-alanyl-D-alanine carboxypeptidase